MGNCQAAEAATVVIQHPGNKLERMYWSVSAHDIMSSNPGHFVALVINSPTERTQNGAPVRRLKLLRPGDTLLLGQVYRLISFKDVLKEFAAKKCVKLGKLLRESGGLFLDAKNTSPGTLPFNTVPKSTNGTVKIENETCQLGSSSSRSTSNNRSSMGRHQWKPALQSIAEIGT